MINFTGIRLSKFNTELELPVDTTDLEDLKDAESVIQSILFFLISKSMIIVRLSRLVFLYLNSIEPITMACFWSPSLMKAVLQ